MSFTIIKEILYNGKRHVVPHLFILYWTFSWTTAWLWCSRRLNKLSSMPKALGRNDKTCPLPSVTFANIECAHFHLIKCPIWVNQQNRFIRLQLIVTDLGDHCGTRTPFIGLEQLQSQESDRKKTVTEPTHTRHNIWISPIWKTS